MARYDEDNDRPRQRKKPRGKNGRPWGLIVGIGGGVAAVVLVAVVVLVLLRGKKDQAANNAAPAGGGGGAAGGNVGPGVGLSAPTEPGEMTGVIGDVEGLRPVVLKPSAEASGLAFRLPFQEGYKVSQVVLPAQPSDFLLVVFSLQERNDSLATAVDRRTGRPIGKRIDLNPKDPPGLPRRPLSANPPDLSQDGRLISGHRVSFIEKYDDDPLRVWDVASGKVVKELRVPAKTYWQGWASPARLMTLCKGAEFYSWSYLDGAVVEGPNPAGLPDAVQYGTDKGGTPHFAVSPDRTKVALPRPNQKCYVILDTATGQELGRTGTISHFLGLLDAIAFSHDGTRLAYLADIPGEMIGKNTGLVIADGTKGTELPPVPVSWGTGGLLVWWGPDLVVHSQLGGGEVFDPRTGRTLAKLKVPDAWCEILPSTTDGRLWIKFDPIGTKTHRGLYVCAYEPTPEIRAGNGETFELTLDGIRPATK